MCRPRPSKVDAALLFQVATLFIVSSSATATDYFVDPGNANACASVQEAVDAVTGQNEFNRANIFIAPGIYHEIVVSRKTARQFYRDRPLTGLDHDQFPAKT